MFIRPADDVVEIAVPSQGIRTEDIGFSPILQFPALGPTVLEVMETDLDTGIDGIVQGVQDLITGFVLGFHTVGDADIAL